jgi:hypothetical protein
MLEPVWRPLSGVPITVDAAPPGLWTKVWDYVEGPHKLRLVASGTWDVARGLSCGPDGDRTQGWVSGLMHSSAPRGALIGMIGGSTAEKPPAALAAGGPLVFVVGCYCVLPLSDQVRGGLYLTMNDSPDQFESHAGQLMVDIHIAR